MMKFYRKIGLAILLACLPAASLSAQQISMSTRFPALMASGDYSGVAKLFHLPEEYDARRRGEEVAQLSQMLAFIQKHLGTPGGLKPAVVPEEAFPVFIYGGSIAYWEKIPLGKPESYTVDFAEEGAGYLSFYYHTGKDGRKRLRMVGYALSEQRPDSKERLTELSGLLFLELRDWEMAKNANPGEMRFSVIVVEEINQARAIQEQLLAGASFADMARTHSKGPGRQVGGDMGFVDPQALDEALQTAAYQLKINEISAPVETANGVFILKKTGEK